MDIFVKRELTYEPTRFCHITGASQLACKQKTDTYSDDHPSRAGSLVYVRVESGRDRAGEDLPIISSSFEMATVVKGLNVVQYVGKIFHHRTNDIRYFKSIIIFISSKKDSTYIHNRQIRNISINRLGLGIEYTKMMAYNVRMYWVDDDQSKQISHLNDN